MFNPKEAAEDSHALNLAILFFAACAVLFSIYLHHDSGLKYWLLKGFGVSAPGRVLVVIDDTPDWDKAMAHYRSSPRNTLKNIEDWANERVVVEFEPVDAAPVVLDFRIKPGELIRETSGALNMTYLPLNPKIAFPSRSLDKFSLDGQILLWSLIAGLLLLVFAIRSGRKWASFRTRLRRY